MLHVNIRHGEQSQPTSALPPLCPGCGRFLRSATEQQRGYCERCPQTASPVPGWARPCCQSEPPCDDCPLFGTTNEGI